MKGQTEAVANLQHEKFIRASGCFTGTQRFAANRYCTCRIATI